MIHLSANQTMEAVSKSSATHHCMWSSRISTRDIAPLRNLSLLLSAAAPAQTTVLIDDDVHGFDLNSSHHLISKFATDGSGIIIGSEMDGISELDIITRLADTIEMIESSYACDSIWSPRDLFHVRSLPPAGGEYASPYVSGGYLAFRIPPHLLFAFPPGYNEDWLWCLLHGGSAQVSILRSGTRVVHDPPFIRKPTREDIVHELSGDLVFDSLEEAQRAAFFDPETALRELAHRLPDFDSMPCPRAVELVERTKTLTTGRVSFQMLEDYGLRILAEMLRSGELELDEKRILPEWCEDAIPKHKSFLGILRDENAMHALTHLVEEGIIA